MWSYSREEELGALILIVKKIKSKNGEFNLDLSGGKKNHWENPENRCGFKKINVPGPDNCHSTIESPHQDFDEAEQQALPSLAWD